MSIQERLHMILKMHNLSPSAFADKLGVQRSNISHVLSGRNKPSLDFLEKIIIQFPRVNAHWLISGQMPTNQSAEAEVEQKPLKKENTTVDRTDSELKNNEILKIVEFYTDGTFTEYHPNKR
jgi:transcriptional regulator with XRE-family HTH domain